MGQQRKLEVLGWALVINNADQSCVVINGASDVVTQNDNIEVRAFNTKSNIQAWIDANGMTLLNPELLEQGE